MSTANHEKLGPAIRSVGLGLAGTLLIGTIGTSTPALATEASGATSNDSAIQATASLQGERSGDVTLRGAHGFLPQGETIKLSGKVQHTHHQATRVVVKEWKHAKMKKIGTTHTNKQGRFHLRHNFGVNRSFARVYVSVPGHGSSHKTFKFRYDYSGQDLSGERFSNRNLQYADFTGADLTGATFTGVKLLQANFSGADLTGATFERSQLQSSTFTEANLAGATFAEAKGRGANFEGARLTDADLHTANFHEGFFTGADLSGANLTGALLVETHFNGAELTGAKLSGAHLDRSNLTEALLTNADLSGAELGGVDFTGADLTGADLGDAVFLQTTMPDGTIINPISQ
jgi:uncharacterized protein YjbI with pentapeptide repeats